TMRSWSKFTRSPSRLWRTPCGNCDTAGQSVKAAKFMYGPRIHMRPDARPRRKLLRRCRGARTTGGIEDDEKSPPAVSRCGVYGVPGASSLSLLLAGARAHVGGALLAFRSGGDCHRGVLVG